VDVKENDTPDEVNSGPYKSVLEFGQWEGINVNGGSDGITVVATIVKDNAATGGVLGTKITLDASTHTTYQFTARNSGVRNIYFDPSLPYMYVP